MDKHIELYYNRPYVGLKDEPSFRVAKLSWLVKMLNSTEEELCKTCPVPNNFSKADTIQYMFYFTDFYLWQAARNLIEDTAESKQLVKNIFLLLLPADATLKAWQAELDIIIESLD